MARERPPTGPKSRGSVENPLATPLVVSPSNHERARNLPSALRQAQGERTDVKKAGRGLESALGLRFRRPELLLQALTHRSFLNEQGGEAADSYERLEFLGDAVLGLVTAAELYRRYPQLPEGELTKSRAALVCQDTLALVARRLDLGDFLLLGKGEEANDGRRRDSILAAAFEAVVAAVYLDRDYATARRFLLRVLGEELDGFFQQGPPPENPKSRLQEQVQGLGHPAPHYRVVSTEGPDHSPLFTVEVLLEGQVAGMGQGRKKVDAERAAAQEALEGLGGHS